MPEYDQVAEPAPFKDRTAGLIVYGGVEIMLGGCCALLIPLVVFSAMMPQPDGSAMELRMMLPAISIFAMAAVFFVWIGIGSILARRWARAVMLVCSWIWLIFGGMGMIIAIWMLPNMFNNMPVPAGQQAPPPQVWVVAQIITGGFMGCIYIILPLAFILFYRSRHVWATCRFRNPRVCWTDGCPLPVLALVILFAYGLLCMVWMPLYNFAVPCFGVFLDGAAGALVVLGVMLLQIYLVWGMYHRKVAAWWTAVLFMVVGSVSGILSMARTDMMELYQRMGMPAEQLDMIEQTVMVETINSLWWLGIPVAVAFLGYLVYVKRYFGLSEGEGGEMGEG